MQEFFNNEKNLEGNISVTDEFLKANNADPQLEQMFTFFIKGYKKLNDASVKHNDKFDKKYLEFILYLTGLFIRSLIVVKSN